METLIFATNNQHKVDEMRGIIGDMFKICSLKQAGIFKEIPEPHDTLEANASEKAIVINGLTGQHCFSEDTGLEVTALSGAPGVKSARYAGEQNSSEANIDKLLKNLLGIEDRSAQFKTVIALILNGKEYQFVGICKGHITEERKGSKGFGYDTVFMPEDCGKTFSEMEKVEKNSLSHRQKATIKMLEFLKSYK